MAEHAGVSKSLVSLVLRGDPHVSESRRTAVQKSMDELGYRPNLHARGLSRARSDLVGVLLNDLRNPWFVDLLEGLSTTLHSAGLEPVLVDSRTDQRVGRRSIATLLARGVDGFVVVGTTTEAEAIREAALTVPVVLAGTRDPDLPGVDVVVDDDLTGGRLATEHLLSLGHERIAHLRGPGQIGDLRLAGHREAMTAVGLDGDFYAETGGMSEESGYAATRRLLTRPDRPTAVFAFNDIVAVGALSAAADHGLSIPGDVSVVGYDNTYLSRIRHISLTSVDNGNFSVGAQAGRFLVQRLQSPSLPKRLHLVPTELQVRGSTGRVPRTEPGN
ncbi:MAG: LacI family DNA-binding transcriptional regulator [Marmoricola sp.]